MEYGGGSITPLLEFRLAQPLTVKKLAFPEVSERA